jgi:hypothetical protein
MESSGGLLPRQHGLNAPKAPRGYLTAIDGTVVTDLEKLETAIMGLRGTPQEPVSSESPETWIEERLKGTVLALAKRIWSASGHRINPR